MINRILIRIKVVQLLYSHFIVNNTFSLEPISGNPTREKRFAYSIYLELLVLMVRLSQEITKRGGHSPLGETRFIERIQNEDRLKSLMMRYSAHEPFPLQALVKPLAERIKNSGIYKNFIKGDLPENQVWPELFRLIISVAPELNAVTMNREDYSQRGIERAIEMVNTTFTNFFTYSDNLSDALKVLDRSLRKARELYFRLLSLPAEITHIRALDIDENRHKYLRSEEDINPNMRFVENGYARLIAENEEIQSYNESNKEARWLPQDETLIRNLLKAIMESPVYEEYMNAPETDLHADSEFWRNLYKHVIFNNTDLLETLEDKSVFWNDDIDIIGTFVLKTVRRIEENMPDAVMKMFKDEEDARFGSELFSATVRGRDEFRDFINQAVENSNWDSERLAYMDVIITMTALAEILNFPKIPLQVSINEYVEIAKAYSTSKSGQFVNGLLGAITAKLQGEGKLLK